MNFMEDHDYCSSGTKVKSEIDKSTLQVPEVSIKTEYDSDDYVHYTEAESSNHVENMTPDNPPKTETRKTKNSKSPKRIKTEKSHETISTLETAPEPPQTDLVEIAVNPESTTPTGSVPLNETTDSISTNQVLCDLKTACVIQACVSLLDSSSSDDDELLLLWLMCKNRKRNLKKKRNCK